MFDYGKKVNTGFAKQSTEIVKAVKKAFGDNIQLDIVAAGYVPDEIFNHVNDMSAEKFSEINEPLNFNPMYFEDNGTKVFSAVFTEGAKREYIDENGEKKPLFIPYIKRGLYGQQLFCDMLEWNSDYNYDGIFIMQDLGVVKPMINEFKRIKAKLKSEKKKQFKSVFYIPIDCEPPAELCHPDLLFFDKLITYTEFGKIQIEQKQPLLKNKVSVVYHGINLKEFYREKDEVVSKFRNEYFGENSDKFIVGVINRNQFRKDMPTAIFSFIAAKERVKELGLEDNLFLYLHCYPEDQIGWKLPLLLSQTDLVEGVDYGFPKKLIREIDAKELNLIYNSLDLYLSTSLGEGFGLTAIECYATKTLTLVPDNTAYSELVGKVNKRSIIYDMVYRVCYKDDNVIRWQGDYEDIGTQIVTVNDKYANNIINNAYDFVQTLSWDLISKKWVEVFKVY
jgi:glycosyltransferase involved in cell wall biosynthesis